MTTIVQNGNPVLRQIAKDVPLADIGSAHLRKVLREMSTALATQEDGVAIAAPQIGYSLRIFVVSGKVTDRLRESQKKEGGEDKKVPPSPDIVFINPVVTRLSKKRDLLEEGCLSVRWLYGKVKRSEKALVTAYDEKGKKFSRSGAGLMAQIFQHEVDHLNGILFVDNAIDVVELSPEKRVARRKKLKAE